MFRWGLATALLGLACVTPPSVPDRPIVPDQVFRQRVTQLPSGLRVLIHEGHNAPLVAVASVVGGGSGHDPAAHAGLAHLVEHLAYRTQTLALKRAGATSNATTEERATTYFQIAPRDRLGELLAIEGARLAAPLAGITPEIVAVERDVVRNELLERSASRRPTASRLRGRRSRTRAPSRPSTIARST
jgi:zinc protease